MVVWSWFELCPLESYGPKPQDVNVILLGNRVSVDDQVKMRFSVTGVLIKRGNLGAGQTGTQRDII